MPAIDPNTLDCVFYIYPNVDCVKSHKPAGGTGFFVGVPLKNNNHLKMIYAVTNKHCIAKSDPRVVMAVNKKDGERDCIPTLVSDWKIHPDGLDIVAKPIVLSDQHKYNFISTDLFFLTPDTVSQRRIGPGDDVFMVGRFIGHDGVVGNLPTARFGNISRMNSEPLPDSNGKPQDSFLVEMRSMPGYSGSPVFVHITPLTPRPPDYENISLNTWNHQEHGPWLLGIDWSHVKDFRPIFSDDRETIKVPREWAEINTGMAGVIPAWRIKELLDLEEFQVQRDEKDEELSASYRFAGSMSEDSADEQPEVFTRQDFESSLRKASRRIPTSEPDSETK